MSGDDPHEKPTAAPTTEERPHDAPTASNVPTKSEGGGARRVTVDEDWVGTTVGGRYKVLSKLGQGGMGVVYLAMHVHIEKKVALKVLARDVARRKNLVARFAQEAKAASRIGQENIINITDFGETATGSAFLAMEYLEGRDLGRELRAEHALPTDRIVRILCQVCRALDAAHAAGIIHRDLKPDNIFLVAREDRPDFVKILDFGIAKVSLLHDGERLTQTGTIFGTAQYMSPEQARGETADARTDVYAAGCILYEMLTGDVPFRADSFMGTLRLQMEEAPEPPSRRAPGRVSAELEAVVLKALQKDRDARYQTMKELALAVCFATGESFAKHWPGGKPVRAAARKKTAAPDAMSARSSPSGARWIVPVVVAAATLAVAAIVMVAWHPWRMAAARTVERPRLAPAATPTAAPIPPAPPTTPATTAPRTSRVAIASTPPNATVLRDGAIVGRTPLVLTLGADAGAFDVTVEHKGFRDVVLRVEPDRDRDYVVTLPPRPRAPSPSTTAATPEKTPPPPAEEHKTPRELKDVLSE